MMYLEYSASFIGESQHRRSTQKKPNRLSNKTPFPVLLNSKFGYKSVNDVFCCVDLDLYCFFYHKLRNGGYRFG